MNYLSKFVNNNLPIIRFKIASPLRGPINNKKYRVQLTNDTVVTSLTYVRTGDDFAKNLIFWKHVNIVANALPEQPGYLGHSIRRVIFGNEGWTMTVWENQESLKSFIDSSIHQTAIENGISAVVQGRFANITLKTSELPISWKTAEQIIATHGRNLY
jgi:heme-degrading monooxygenase HmoA